MHSLTSKLKPVHTSPLVDLMPCQMEAAQICAHPIYKKGRAAFHKFKDMKLLNPYSRYEIPKHQFFNIGWLDRAMEIGPLNLAS